MEPRPPSGAAPSFVAEVNLGYWPLSIPAKHKWSLLILRVALFVCRAYPFEVLVMPALHGTKVPYRDQKIRGGAMELFQAEMVAAIEHQSSKTCRRCNARLHLVKVMVDSDTGDVVHMFECQCGERIWIE